MPTGTSWMLEGEPRTVKLPRHRLRTLAETLFRLHPLHSSPLSFPPVANPITAVCISDTHNTQPDLPAGDILLHAGDLTENGSFDEIQTQLTWLSSQPHRFKVLVAGNHDVLLDESFLAKYPERRYGQTKTMDDLDWGTVLYLRDSHVTVNLPDHSRDDVAGQTRALTIYGSPTTPQYGISAFQVPRDEDVWTGRVPQNTDILVTHGPPRMHLDGSRHAGCPFLAREVARVQPQLVVFGHIHVAYGRKAVVFDGVRQAYEGIIGGWAGWGALCRMAVEVLLARVESSLSMKKRTLTGNRVTNFVNAAVVGGPENQLQNRPVVVEL